MAIMDRMKDRMAARRNAMMTERDARRAELMAERLSRMADRPMRTPELTSRPAPIQPNVGVSSLRKAENARRVAIGMPLLPDPTLPVPQGETLDSMLGRGIGALSVYGGGRPIVGDMLGSGTNALSIYRQPVPQPEMTQQLMPQMPTQPGGKGGQIATQPGGKGAGSPAMGAGLSALNMYR